MEELDRLSINTIRTLAMDAVEEARSGHPGTPMAMAPVVYTLWQRHLRFDPHHPDWPNRDRFVLSAGHASMLLYAMLFLTDTQAIDERGNASGRPAVTLQDIKRFRRLDSKCPGHPEYRLTTGVEATTGPLGQGAANSIGMAIAAEWQARHFNRPGFALFDFRVYALLSDGDMMEGIASEAASLAGHLKLPNLCWIYDSNRISIEGATALAFDEDPAARFASYGWNVIRLPDANDTEALDRALTSLRNVALRPTLIIVSSHIGYGASHKHDSSEAHGEPLGAEEVRAAKRAYGWPEDAKFLVPSGVKEHLAQSFGARGRALYEAWSGSLERYRREHPDLAEALERMKCGGLPDGWDALLPRFAMDAKGVASRESAGKALNAVAERIPWLLGGAADLAPSTKTNLTFKEAGDFSPREEGGRNFHFGVREHAMGAIVNGLVLSKLRAYGSTFLIFSDYMRPAIRLSALMRIPSIWIFTHDSIGLGEDGPTHQPIEQLAGLRAIPGLIVLRPCDANEVVEAWRVIVRLERQPACLVLSRQPLPTLDRKIYAPAAGLARGAYVLADPKDGAPEVVLIASGSEVAICLEAHRDLSQSGVRCRVVSTPSWELFEQQDEAYRRQVLPPGVAARVSVEAASVFGWERYVGRRGHMIGMQDFGASAPIKELLVKFGFTAEKIADAAREQLARSARRAVKAAQ